jgi:hypothetical protein
MLSEKSLSGLTVGCIVALLVDIKLSREPMTASDVCSKQTIYKGTR